MTVGTATADGLRLLAQHDLDGRGALREGLTREAAADLLWFYIQPVHWDLLVQQRGWSRAAYRTWLRTSLELHLLGLS